MAGFLILSAMFMMGGFAILLPSILYVLQNLGASEALATPVLAAYSFAQFISGPYWGRLSDSVGRKPALIASFCLVAVAYCGLSVWHNSLWLVTAWLALAGAASGGLAGLYASAVDATDADGRAQAMGLIGAGVGIAFVAGSFVGAELGGHSAAAADITLPAQASTICALLGLLTTLIWFKSPLRRVSGQAQRPRSLVAIWDTLKGRVYLLHLSAIMLFFTAMLALMETLIPFVGEERLNFGPREMGYLFTYVGFVLVLVQGGLVGRLAQRFGEARLITSGMALMAAGMLVIGFAAGLIDCVIGLTLVSVGSALFSSALSALASHQTDASNRGQIMGAVQAMQSLGRSFGPLIAGLLYQWHEAAPFLMATFVILALLAFFSRGRQNLVAEG